MGKHSYEDLDPREIISYTRVFPRGIGFDHCGLVETITITRYAHSGNNVFATGMVPSRPTGAHRHDRVPVDIATYVYATFVECVRNPTPGMMEFEYIIPSV